MDDIVVTFPGGKRVDAGIGPFVIQTDQEGGAPPPFTYCLAALATCAGIYALSYLQARGLSSEGLGLVQTHQADPKTGRIAKVRMTLKVPKGLPEEHVAPLLRSAEKCAVKKLIENPPTFEILAERPV